MPQKRFGGEHTAKKLQHIEKYLDMFTTALKDQNFNLIYFDAFAGTGDIPQSNKSTQSILPIEDYAPIIVGSARRALMLSHPFDEYVFVDKKKANVESLKALRSKFPSLQEKISIRQADANVELSRFCEERNWRKSRAVVFLDPFGNNVAWETLEAIAASEAIDLWYLFPAGLGVHRQIGKDGSVHDTHGGSLDKMLGCQDWREAFIEARTVEDLFGIQQNKLSKVADPDAITEFMIRRMRTVFQGGVLDDWLPLGSRNIHMYSLIFAWANPSEKAKLAGKLAAAVLKVG